MCRQFKVDRVLRSLYAFGVEIDQKRFLLRVFLHALRRIQTARGFRLSLFYPADLLHNHLYLFTRIFLGRGASEKGLVRRRRVLRRRSTDLDLRWMRAQAVFLSERLV